MIERVKFAVYDPTTKLFAAKNKDNSWTPRWTDKLDNIQTYVGTSHAVEMLRRVSHKNPNAFIAEMTVSITWKEATQVPVALDQQPTYLKFKATYEELLPFYMEDAEAMSKKDWDRFCSARNFLRNHGVTVER